MPIRPPADGPLNTTQIITDFEIRIKITFQKDANILYVESSLEDALTSRCLGKMSAVVGVRFCPSCLGASIFKSDRLMSDDPFSGFYPADTSKPRIFIHVSLCAGRWRRFHGHKGNEASFDLGVSACQQRPPSRPPHVCSPDPFPSASSLARHMCLFGVWEHYRLQSAMASDR